MTKNDISTLILKGDKLSIIEHEGLFYISSFCFNNKEDLAVFYSHKAVSNRFVCLPSKGKYFIVTSCFVTRKEAEIYYEEIKDTWYSDYFLRTTYPTELTFYRDWYDEDYIQEHFPKLLLAEKR